MPTIVTHAVAAGAIAAVMPLRVRPRGLVVAAALSAVVPDFDVVAFDLGIPYGHTFGHRGFSHSVLFAVLFAWALVVCWPRDARLADRWRVWGVLASATASHGVLDAMTDGGRGVGFWAPLMADRYFFPWRPLAVSPIGGGFLTARTIDGTYRWVGVVTSELLWVWLPAALVSGVVVWNRHRLPVARDQPIGGRS